MMRIMNTITDKPDWQLKVFDKRITTKWREEVAQSAQDVSARMMDWIIAELKWKADKLRDIGFSDNAISPGLRAALKEAVSPLEDVPEDQRDYHPGSNGKVIDLVHPSLFPLEYGRTRVLPDRVIGLDDCLESIGQGTLLLVPSESDIKRSEPSLAIFQWLPCEVDLADTGLCRIISYINNAHPVKHRALYQAAEKILAQTIPLWQSSLTKKPFRGDRIKVQRSPPDDAEGYEFDQYEECRTEWYASRRIKQPEPGVFKVTKPLYPAVNFQKRFPNQKIQVIVKLASIMLTPEKPDYEGGAWHIEGQLNERIAASAIYYYDSHNITASSLAFRHRGMSDLYDSRNEVLITQDLGSVDTKEGRLLTFPNTLQHRVSLFFLADRSKPGHRKILALFLVNPHHRIISSANVPPQREGLAGDWRPCFGPRSGHNHDDHGGGQGIRLELMEERGLSSQENNNAFEMGEFCL
ncbi:DUF4246 domain-containing protein [Aspergillus foveolatus]|uniref:DUF4246 domain-containing protein n=1 Tax=Aspergillus foveolatus TaxID=210207 RepID=UPI003CCDC1ED